MTEARDSRTTADTADGFDIWGKQPRIDAPQGMLAQVEELLAPMLADLGFDLVRLQLHGQKKPTLQIMAEPSDGSLMTVEHCSQISYEASALLDVDDPIESAYTLEVSSPGLDRPLVCPRDFSLWQGYEARIESHAMIEGQRRFRGILAGWDDTCVLLDADEGRYVLAFDDIARAKLMLSDALVEDAMKGRLPCLPENQGLSGDLAQDPTSLTHAALDSVPDQSARSKGDSQ